jgi:hypothetical protein
MKSSHTLLASILALVALPVSIAFVATSLCKTPSTVVPESRPSNTNLFSTLVSQPVEQVKYMELLAWLKENGATINDKIELRASSQGDGYGAFVQQPVSEGELLFEIPRALCLTLEDATGDAECGESFSKLIEKAGPGGNTVAMAGYMAKEYLVSLEDEDDDTKKSRWGPYLQTLPWKRGVNNQEHILFWEDARVEKLLDGSLCYGEATSLREEVALAIRVLTPMVSKSIRVARGEETSSGFRFPWQVNDQNDKEVRPKVYPKLSRAPLFVY